MLRLLYIAQQSQSVYPNVVEQLFYSFFSCMWPIRILHAFYEYWNSHIFLSLAGELYSYTRYTRIHLVLFFPRSWWSRFRFNELYSTTRKKNVLKIVSFLSANSFSSFWFWFLLSFCCFHFNFKHLKKILVFEAADSSPIYQRNHFIQLH